MSFNFLGDGLRDAADPYFDQRYTQKEVPACKNR